jgi:endonuclease III
MAARRTRLQRLLAILRNHQGPQTPPSRDPWHLILWENVAYLADDDARAAAFAALREATGLDPDSIGSCPEPVLRSAAAGRMPGNQVRKLRECAALFRTVGNPQQLVKLPLREARKALQEFPGIGEPGADKLMSFAGRQDVLALDSNGLRVLLRLGYGSEAKNYARSYRSAQEEAMAELPGRGRDHQQALVQAHLSLRAHGQLLCRRTAPQCGDCPLQSDCPGRST